MSDEERTPSVFDSPPTYQQVITQSYGEALHLKPIKPEVVVSEQPNHRLGQHPSESVVHMIYSQNNSSNDHCCKNCELLFYCCLCCFEVFQLVTEIAK